MHFKSKKAQYQAMGVGVFHALASVDKAEFIAAMKELGFSSNQISECYKGNTKSPPLAEDQGKLYWRF